MLKIIISLLMITGMSFAADGRSLSSKCVACHGVEFEKSALGKSAIVNGLSASDIYASLIGYKQGTRNAAGMGALMKGQVASMSNNDLWAVAEYIASLSDHAAPAAEEPAPAADAAPASNWPFACDESTISWVDAGRYFKVASSDTYPGIGADSKTIQIDRKNKIIKVWTIWLASEEERQAQANKYGTQYNNYGYVKSFDTIDYRNMRSKGTSMTEYECNGNVIQTFNTNNTWSQIVPDSVMEGMTQRIMKKYNLK